MADREQRQTRSAELPMLELKGVRKTYGEVEALSGLSLSCDAGTTTVILGPSGAGKTTTLELIAGLKTLDSGGIRIRGRCVDNLEPKDRNVAMTFEQYSLYPHLTVFENVASPLRVTGASKKRIEERVVEVTRMLGIGNFLKRKPSNLSGGQRQRVALARSLVKEADVFLMDEPLSHLDAKLRHQMRGEFRHIQEELGNTVLYVTHDWREALSLADAIVVLNKGEVVQTGTPREVYEQPATRFVAELVGDPPMNFFSGLVEECADGFVLNTPECSVRICRSDICAGPSLVGVRPGSIVLTDSSEDANGRGEVYAFEYFGNEAIVTIQAAERLLKVKLTGGANQAFAIGQQVCFRFEPDHCHFFESETAQATARSGG
jgi:multiple sugar transport system ATP-binding protein